MKIVLALLAVLTTTTALAENKVIYGIDNRSDVMSYRGRRVVDVSRSTVALVKSENLAKSGVQFTLQGETFKEKFNLCSGERFADQPAAAFCSGFLVGENKIVTAGHCVTTQATCDDVRFVFDYKMKNSRQSQLQFAESQVYSCKKVLGWKKDDVGADFAIIELDRPVVGRRPLKLSDNSGLRRKTEVLVIGHPSGLPTKITDGASVRNIQTEGGYFVANLDTYGGNSGSAVFNARTLEVEGILVRGEKDYETDEDLGCRRSFKVGNEDGRGEDVTLISQVVENDGLPTEIVSEEPSIGGIRYIWLDSDNTCNLFMGTQFVMEVSNDLCPNAPTVTSNTRYVWLDTDATCNEFNGPNYVREVADSLCGAAATANVRYIWLDSDMTCNLFNGSNYIREVADNLCPGH